MKKLLYLVCCMVFISMLANCKKEKNDEDKPTVEVTILNVGFSSWKVLSVQHSNSFAQLETNNAVFVFEKGRRYKIINMANVVVHPFEIRNASNQVLLSQNITDRGSLQSDATINFQFDETSISFTVSPSFEAEVATYNCANHNGMKGMVGFQ